MNRRLPFQKMLQDLPLQVFSLHDFSDDNSYRQHRHRFYMLLWVTKGAGAHQVNFKTYDLTPGQVLFVQDGQVHRVISQPEEGVVVLFTGALFRAFILRHPAQEQYGLFDYLSRDCAVTMDAATKRVFNSILPLLCIAARQLHTEALMADYLSILLVHLNELFKPFPVLLVHPAEEEQMRALKNLIERYYLEERGTSFYAAQLGVVNRKLNQLCMRFTGRLVQELVYDRLFSEAEALLGGTALTIKEITYRLKFTDHAHFAFFFKKQRGLTPSAFRKEVTGLY